MAVEAAVSEPAPQYPPYTGRGLEEVRGEKTGFFHAEKQSDRWWLIDPNGKGFYIFGVQGVTYAGYILGRRPYHESVLDRYGSEEAWAEETVRRLQGWGFNMVGQSSSTALRHRGVAHVELLWLGWSFGEIDSLVPPAKDIHGGFPNVFSPEWPVYCDEQARAMCAPGRDDPWLIGYYLDNELPWWGCQETWQGEFGLFMDVWRLPSDNTGKQAWVEFMRTECGTIGEFNETWETEYRSFDELAASTEAHNPPNERAEGIARAFLRLVAERFFGVLTAAVRRHDPNHMILGARIGVIAPDAVWEVCSKYCDVVTWNSYPPVDPDRGLSREYFDYFLHIGEKIDKPAFLTEWSHAAQSESPVCGGAHLIDQEQRGRAAASMQRTLLSLPFMVGTCWYLYIDHPRDDFASTFETGNCGMVNRFDEPYEEFTSALAEVHPQAAQLHAGGVLLDGVYDPPPALHWQHPLPEQEARDAAFRSGALELAAGDDGSWTVKYDRHPVADWSPALWRGTSEDTSIRPSSCSIMGVRQDAQFTVVDAAFEGKAVDGAAFKTGWRFWVPRHPSDWAGAQCLYVENAGRGPLKVEALVPWHQHEGAGQDDPGTLSRANSQGLYIPLGAVDYPELGAGFGVTTVEEGIELVHLRASDDTSWQSYCRQPLGLELDPGQRHAMGGSIFVLFGYRAGNPCGHLTALKEKVGKVRAAVSDFCSPVEPENMP